MQELYTLERPDFYDEQANSPNPLRKWFHRTRHINVRRLVEKHIRDGKVVADIGCGNVVWNWGGKFDVIGVDINPEALEYNIQQGRLVRGVHASVENIEGLEDEAADLVVCSEVIEHIPNFWDVMKEAKRILKPGGRFVVTVPYDTWFSLWGWLFPVQCFVQGTLKGDEYYKQKCGHINHFNPTTIKQYLVATGFQPVEQFDMKRFTIFTVVEKPRHAS